MEYTFDWARMEDALKAEVAKGTANKCTINGKVYPCETIQFEEVK